MKLSRNILTISLLTLALTACSTIEQHSNFAVSRGDKAYLKAQNNQGLQVPPGLSATKVGNDYTIPPVTGTGAIPASITPPGGVSSQVPPGYQAPGKSKTTTKGLF